MNKFSLFVYIFLFSKASISSENLESTICKQRAYEIAANKGITSLEGKIKLWKNYEQQCSSSGIYQLLLGDFYGSYGYYNEAKQILEKTIENKQFDTREHKLLLQSIYQALGEVENLKNLTKKMIVEYPNWSGSFYSLGNYYFVIEEWNNAKKYLEKAVELSDETAELSAIYLKLALVFYELNENNQVIYYYKKAFLLDSVRTSLTRTSSFAAVIAFIKKGDFNAAKDILNNQKKFDKTVHKSDVFCKAKNYYENELKKLSTIARFKLWWSSTSTQIKNSIYFK